MKTFFAISVFIISLWSSVGYAKNEELIQGRGIGKIDISDQIDGKLILAKQFLLEKGYDPLALPNVTKPITIQPVLIKHHGTLTLTNGWLQGLRTIVREGPAYLVIGFGSSQKILLNLTITNIEFGYDYHAKFKIMRPSGQVLGYANDLQLYLELTYNIFKKIIQLKKAAFYSVGDIDIQLSGNVIGDIFGNMFVGSAVEKIRESVLDALNQALNNAIDDINEALKPKRTTTTTTTTTTTVKPTTVPSTTPENNFETTSQYISDTDTTENSVENLTDSPDDYMLM